MDLWGKLGETINQYLTKGKLVAVEGVMRQDRWEQDGQTRSKTVISANNVQFLGSPGGQGVPSGPAGPSYERPQTPTAKPGSPPAGPADDFTDDIPF